MRKITLFVFVSLMVCGQAIAQPTVAWDTTFGVGAEAEAKSVLPLADGSAVVCGSDYNMWVGYCMKLDPEGNVIWYASTDELDPNFYFYPSDIRLHADGYVLAGVTTDGTGEYDAALAVTDSVGHIRWHRSFGGPEWDRFNAVRSLTNGDIVAVGSSNNSAQQYDMYVVRTDSQGTMLWERSYASDSNDVATDLVEVSGGDIVVAGWSGYWGENVGAIILIRYDATGDTVWFRRVSSSDQIRAHGLALALDSTLIAAGCWDCESSNTRLFMLRERLDGVLIWQHAYSDWAMAQANGITVLPDGSMVVTGCVQCYEQSELVLARFAPSGTPLWSIESGYEWSRGNRLALASDGSYVVVGSSWWEHHLRASYVMRTTPDVVSVSPPATTPVPESVSLSAYPNPFNATTTITFSLPTAGAVELRVYDVTGRLVKTLMDEVMSAGTHRMSVDGTALASGVYLARLTTNEQSLTQKLLLIK